MKRNSLGMNPFFYCRQHFINFYSFLSVNYPSFLYLGIFTPNALRYVQGHSFSSGVYWFPFLQILIPFYVLRNIMFHCWKIKNP